jgi:hypothetical protein
MAKKRDKDLLETLRKTGLRKKVARALTGPDAKTTRGKQAPLVTRPDAALPPAKLPRPGRSGASLRQLASDGESSRSARGRPPRGS